MMFIDPPAAKNLLPIPLSSPAAGAERANKLRLRGARFPFATITGMEDSGTWQHVDLEIHADMAVAYAIWHHDKICRDKEFLYHEGIEMLLQICRFMPARGAESQYGDFGFLWRDGAG